MKKLRLIVIVSLMLLKGAETSPAAPGLSAWVGSSYLLPGEESELWLTITSDTRPLERPKAPETKSLSFKFLGDTVLPHSTSERTYTYRYVVLSYQKGLHSIPSFSLNHKGDLLESPSLQIQVQDLPETAWFTSEIGGELHDFASTTSLPARIPFEGETVLVEAKIYLPSQFQVDKASIAELAREGIAAERFDVSAVIPGGKMLASSLRLKQKDYTGITYRSNITPLSKGAISIGPGKASLTLLARISRRGLTQIVPVPLQLPLPRTTTTARSLPLPQPEGFNNAIGEFSITARAASGRMRERDPISIQLAIEGTGNLKTVAPPEFTGEDEAWKAYPPHRLSAERIGNDTSGSVTFSQTVRPRGYQSSIPPFRFISFNPETEKYLTLHSAPIPLEISPAATSPGTESGLSTADDALFNGIENILGIKSSNFFEDPKSGTISRAWHLLPALLSVILLLQLFRSRILPYLTPSEGDPNLRRALDALEKGDLDPQAFLRRAGSLIERSIPEESRDDEIRDILAKRDHYCYRPDKKSQPITDSRRQEILQHLRQQLIKSASAIILLFTLSVPQAEASVSVESDRQIYRQAEAAWNAQSFRVALELYQTAQKNRPSSPDLLFNIGNCHFQLGRSGMASLYYHRALQLNPAHPEAIQNLRFLQARTGALRPPTADYAKWISIVSRNTYSIALAVSLWLVLLATLSLLQAHRFRKFYLACLRIGALTAIVSSAGFIAYPTLDRFAAEHERAIMINSVPIMGGSSATTLKPQAKSDLKGTQNLFAIAPGSLCRLIATRGKWTYIELPNGLRAWVPSNSACAILPVSKIPNPF